MFQIMYGTQMKLEFKLADKQEQGFSLKKVKYCLQYHPQALRMVNYKMCNECCKVCSTRVLHLQRMKTMG